MREYSIGNITGLDSILPLDLAEKLANFDARKIFTKNTPVYNQGDAADHVFFLLQGRVKSILIRASGQQSILRIHLPHSILGLTALASQPIRDATAICLDSVVVVAMSRTRFVDLLRSEPELGIHVVKLLTDRMSDFHHRVGDLLEQPVKQRLARALLVLSTPDPGGGGSECAEEIPLSHEELAQLINTRRPTVSSILARFAEQGAVRKSGRQLKVLDRDYLDSLTAKALSD